MERMAEAMRMGAGLISADSRAATQSSPIVARNYYPPLILLLEEGDGEVEHCVVAM